MNPKQQQKLATEKETEGEREWEWERDGEEAESNEKWKELRAKRPKKVEKEEVKLLSRTHNESNGTA